MLIQNRSDRVDYLSICKGLLEDDAIRDAFSRPFPRAIPSDVDDSKVRKFFSRLAGHRPASNLKSQVDVGNDPSEMVPRIYRCDRGLCINNRFHGEASVFENFNEVEAN